MTPESIYTFIAKRDGIPTNEALMQMQLDRYKRLMKHPRSDKHKTYLREGIYNTKKVLNERQ
jgi:hypothetical protein